MLKQLIPERFCLKCQGCCRFKEQDSVWSPKLLEEEEKFIPSFGLMSSAEGVNNFICRFLNFEDNRCNIYATRPFECQLYPFLLHRKEGKVFLALDLNCFFLKENPDLSVLKKYSQGLAQLFNNSQFKKIFKNNPQIIHSYSDAKILEEIVI